SAWRIWTHFSLRCALKVATSSTRQRPRTKASLDGLSTPTATRLSFGSLRQASKPRTAVQQFIQADAPSGRGLIQAVGGSKVAAEATAMRSSRFRFTVRWLLVFVAVAGVASWWFIARAVQFRRLAHDHSEQATRNTPRPMIVGGTPLWFQPTPLLEWHLAMEQKYAYAASHPWFPVTDDPPPPSAPPQSFSR